MERLGKELLHLSGTGNYFLVFFRQFFHTQNRNDVLQFFVFLQIFLHLSGCLIVFFSHYICFQNTGTALQRVNRRINTLLYNLSGQNRGGIQMRKGGGRRRVCQVIGRHINSLYRSNRTIFCGSDTLLQFTHFRCQRRLITYGRRHTSQKGGNF